ncbi:MAG TPA: ABC transporter substrate-binding protein, partial [Candidatus Limnocylindrales bacterium]|nr:ABC transporter substrate-binding protein [Candidatus Limnocylindrales bacterium]
VGACAGAASPSPSAPASAPPSQAASPAESAPASPAAQPASVRLQLQWVPQAQFAGYFAADREGYYAAENLTVEILAGGPDIVPQQVGSAPDGPEFTLSWVPKVLEAREQGSDLVNIAQVFQRSGTLSVAWKDSGIDDPCDVKGKRVGVWDFGNEFEVTAGLLNNCGFVAGTDYEKVIQAFDMVAFLNREIDLAEAMIYNEYAQVLETTNPETGELYKPEDLNVINWNDYRSAMLQDAIWARKSWLEQGNNRDVAVRFVRASLKGWIFCRDNPDTCVQYTTEAGSQLGAGHQRWMMNEINALIWPSPLGVGVVDPVFWQQTVKIAKQSGIIKNDPAIDTYVTDIVEEAMTGVEGDLKGEGFQKAQIEVTPGGN